MPPRTFETKQTARPAATPPSELYYSTRKLVTWTAISGVFVAMSVWIIASGGIGSDYHGRDAGIAHLLDPQGTIILFGPFGAGCLVLGIAYLRLLFAADRLVARADADGLAINGVWGARSFTWDDVRAISLHLTTARSREISFIKVASRSHRDLLVPISTIEGGRPAVEQWIADAQARLF